MPEPLAAGAEYEGMAAAQPDAGAAAPASVRPNAWSAEEDDKLVALVARYILQGQPKGQAISVAAHELGRPFEGTGFRIRSKLADRLTAEIDRLRADALADLIQTHQSDPAPQPVAEEAAGNNVSLTPAADQPADAHPPVPTSADDPADGAAVSPAPSATLSPIEAHLHGLPRKGGWTMERDHELLELICAGWAMPEISAEMAIQAGDVKARFDLLSGLHRNAEDKMVRRWTRDELLAALTPWVKVEAAE